MLNTVQEKLEKNVKKVKTYLKDVIEQAERYAQDEIEKLQNEAIKE